MISQKNEGFKEMLMFYGIVTNMKKYLQNVKLKLHYPINFLTNGGKNQESFYEMGPNCCWDLNDVFLGVILSLSFNLITANANAKVVFQIT